MRLTSHLLICACCQVLQSFFENLKTARSLRKTLGFDSRESRQTSLRQPGLCDFFP